MVWGNRPKSLNNFHIAVSALLSFAVKRSYAMVNPFDAIDKVRVPAKAPGILSPEECQNLLKGGLHPSETDMEMICYLPVSLEKKLKFHLTAFASFLWEMLGNLLAHISAYWVIAVQIDLVFRIPEQQNRACYLGACKQSNQ